MPRTFSLTTRVATPATIAVLALLTFGGLPLEAQNTGIAGVVKNAAGKPVVGALVKVKNDGLGLAFTVVSQREGKYITPNLPPGKYQVQTFGGANQSTPAGSVEVSSGRQTKLDLVLNAP